MKASVKYLLLIVPIAIFFSCSTEPESHTEYYLLKVDSLQHPPGAALNDTIKIMVFGLAGTDGCHSFSHFESLKGPLVLDLKVWGKVVPDKVCLTVLVPFREEFSVVGRVPGKYTINIHQPDGSIMKDSLIIR